MALIKDNTDANDYTLTKEDRSCWVTVDNLSVYIVRTCGGVAVDIFPKGHEADVPVAGTWAPSRTCTD